MKYLGKDDDLLNVLHREAFLPNATIDKIDIALMDHKLTIEIHVKIAGERSTYLKLLFSGVRQYAFNYMANRVFYTIETYKLLTYENLIYVSFDPIDDDLSKFSEDDNDIISCERIEGYLFVKE